MPVRWQHLRAVRHTVSRHHTRWRLNGRRQAWQGTGGRAQLEGASPPDWHLQWQWQWHRDWQPQDSQRGSSRPNHRARQWHHWHCHCLRRWREGVAWPCTRRDWGARRSREEGSQCQCQRGSRQAWQRCHWCHWQCAAFKVCSGRRPGWWQLQRQWQCGTRHGARGAVHFGVHSGAGHCQGGPSPWPWRCRWRCVTVCC